MDDTLFNFVVYFSLNKNSVNHWFFTPFIRNQIITDAVRPRAPLGNYIRRRRRQLKKTLAIGLMIKTTALTCITLFSTFL